MTELALPTLPRVLPDSLARSRRQSATFLDLVHARFQWKSEHSASVDAARERYETIRATFEADHGKIVDEHWSGRFPVGVVTCRRRERWGREQWWLHRQTGSLASDQPEFSRLLRDAARQSVRASNVLSGMSQRIAISNLFLADQGHHRVARHRGGGADRTRDLSDRPRRDRRLHRAGRSPRGPDRVPQGRPARAGGAHRPRAGARLAINALDTPDVDPMLFVGSVIAGSLGATMSVLMRMSGGKFDVNHEIGREYVSNLGLARPYIGAVFALLLYFAIQGGLVDQVNVPKPGEGELAFYVAGAFAIGFSERFAKEIVRSAEGRAGAGTATQPRRSSASRAEVRAQGVERRAQRFEVGAQRGHLVLQPGDARIGDRAAGAAGGGGGGGGAASSESEAPGGGVHCGAGPAPAAGAPSERRRRRAGACSAPPSARAARQAHGELAPMSRSSASSTAGRSASGCRRSVRCLSSPGVWARGA
jgi:hypothetical protein